ncbi:hypothetical protein JB92DRAFT_1920872 [Gautieria morchelliformis]|nr:hypothetical protein JB92DRAFT_1920872 [Gautieria morchelliformis]
MLLREVERRHPTINADKLHRYCRQGHVKVELHCQLALMPVCYLTNSPANSVLIYSKNINNLTAQRRYIVRTFHIGCFRRSELTLRRYYILKFVIDACVRYRNDIPREKRDVHWLVKVYLEDYNAIFQDKQRPRLHRSEVYDHFAMHGEWLGKVFRQKQLLDRSLWEEWMDDCTLLKRKARRRKLKWGAQFKRQVMLQDDQLEQDDYVASDDNTFDHMVYLFQHLFKLLILLPGRQHDARYRFRRITTRSQLRVVFLLKLRRR